MSSFSRPLSPDEIAEIGRSSALRNADDGITGVLLSLGSVFFQVFEGDDEPIDHLYARVLRDDRHTDIICLRTELDTTTRLFPDWSMNVFDLDHVGGEVVDALKLVIGRMTEAQHIIGRYTQPAVSRTMMQGLNPLDVPLRKVDRLVLFTDMVGFSAISDRLPIDDVSDLVTAYLEACSVAIDCRGGEVTKFLGDGVMAYFDADGTDDALQACLDIQSELQQIRESAPDRSARRVLYSGFGLAVGPVLEGSIGSSTKMDYTIIGEPVNSAARVEALTRRLGRPVLMTDSVAETAGSKWETSFAGHFDIGRDDDTALFALDSGASSSDGMQSAVAEYLDVIAAPRL